MLAVSLASARVDIQLGHVLLAESLRHGERDGALQAANAGAYGSS